ncbi:endonuclease MutS2 [Cellulosilyticum sp. I15G10I2]|uniref:endonuclease MutS2 n=1 Tax=Cellulosilyticum sp. I15G10I2 TaxID=1892843 RepID=UPI00085C1B4F|nr:mannonate oxidoreductase [Cellulosilyticum sp. I15G10I2]
MQPQTFEKLQYDVLKGIVKEYCVSSLGKKLIDKLIPSGNKAIVEKRLQETQEAKQLIDYSGTIPLQGIMNIEDIIEKAEKGIILDPEILAHTAAFLRGCRKIKSYMKDKTFYAPILCSYSLGIETLDHLEEELARAIKNNKVDDHASNELKKIRRYMALTEAKIEERLNKFLKSSQNKPYIQEFFVSKRQGKLTIPIKASYKNQVQGTIIETSPKGTTVFIEPSSVSKYTQELLVLVSEEQVEEYKVLAYLTGLILDHSGAIKRNIEVMGEYDMIFAKAKYSKSIEGIMPKVNQCGKIVIKKGRHPLLKGDVVPLEVEIGKDFRSLIITGPNAGGKTIVLKTVGLLVLAMQSGFHLPAAEGTELSVFDKVFVDIGDDQSMENALSTFSSHVKNLAAVIQKTNKATLLLFDEIGSGTEPSEGAALAIAILEAVYQKGAITLATTHYGEIKTFSASHPDFQNAAMRFNSETLEPLYQLIVGEEGESNALWISKKMGIQDSIINRAKKYMVCNVYDLEKVNPAKIRRPQEIQYKSIPENVQFHKGDKVFLNEYNDFGIVYSPQDKYNNLIVLYNKQLIEVHVKKIKLEIKAKELYPEGYDLESLFTSFTERKLERDIQRGSKKALKRIKKYGIEELKHRD